MGEQAKRSLSARFWITVIAVCAVAAVAADLLVWQPWAVKAESSSSAAGQALAASGLVAKADFPSSPGLKADVKTVDTTPEMLAGAPSSFKSLGAASFAVVGGDFPASGATITVDLPAPAADGHGIMIAHWNQQAKEWEPVPTRLSDDRLHATATVAHFSEYGFWDYLFNAVNQVAGNAATSGVQCDTPMPKWADPQYFDDINGPVLWCGGKDKANADVLVAKLKMNRAYATKISTAIKPAWVWSDMWDNMGPETMLQMITTAAMANPGKAGDDYVVQPLGEYDFGFSRSDLEKFYADGRWDKPLVEVGIGWQYTAFGWMYDQMKDASQGNIAGAFAMLSLGQCSYELSQAPNADGAAAVWGTVMGCIGSSMDAIEKGAITFVSKKASVDSARAIQLVGPVASKLKFLVAAYGAASSALKIFTTVGDLSLPDNTRQFLYQPSIDAIKEAAAAKKAAAGDKTYSGSAVDISYSFSYPANWSVSGSQNDLTVRNGFGVEMARLGFLEVWGAESPPMSASVAAQSTAYGGFMVQPFKGPGGCASCTVHISSKIVDSRTATEPLHATSQDPVTALGWPLPVMVSTAISGEQAPLTEVDPRFLGFGVVTVDSGVKGGNGDTKRAVIVGSARYFASIDEAKAWMGSPEHAQVEKMLASLRVP